MAKTIDNQADDSVVPETAYQDDPKPMASRLPSRSVWVLFVLAVLIGATGLYVGLGNGSHTDPAPNGASNGGNASAQPAPTQNSN